MERRERERERERERKKVVKTIIVVKGEMKVVWSIQPLIPFMFLRQREGLVTGTSKA